MSPPLELRLATPTDLPAILEIVRAVVPLMRAVGNLQWGADYPNSAVFTHDIDQDQLWVALQNDRPVGVAALTTTQEPEYAQVGWDLTEPAIVVHRLAVDPASQGMGVATALMLHAEHLARSRRIGVVRVDTSAENAATQRLFSKLGYTFAGELALAFRPGLRVLAYQKQLHRSEENS
jgi:ribosomal protein S18 acetylase RimI-like enzyme